MLYPRPPRFARMSRDWDGRSVFLLGGGPSLRGFDFLALQERGIVVAINDAIRAVPWADCGFTIDVTWLGQRQQDIAEFVRGGREMLAAVPASYMRGQAGVRYVERQPGAWLSDTMTTVYTGDNSGFAALGMAMQRGAKRIALLGYDMTVPGHFHAGYPWVSRYGAQDYGRWAAMFGVLATFAKQNGVSIINCNPASAVACFPFGSWEEVAE